jgi:hypothetical protein
MAADEETGLTPRARTVLLTVALILTSLSFALMLFQVARGERVSWISMAVPTLVFANTIVIAWPKAKEYPRATRVYWVLSIVASIAVLVGLMDKR